MLFRTRRMNTLNGQILDGCSIVEEHPFVVYEPFVDVDRYEKPDSFERIEAQSSRSDCSAPIKNYDHNDFLVELFDMDQWKSNTSSLTEENAEEQLNSIGNDSESNEIIDAMEWIDKFGLEEIAENVNSTSSLNYLDNDAQRQVDDLLEQAASVVDWKAWSSYLNDSVDYELDGCPDAIEIKDNVPLTAEHSMGNTTSNGYLNDNVDIEFDDCTNSERNKVKDEGLLSLVGNMDKNAAWKCYLNNNMDVDFDDCLSTSEVEDDGSLSFVGDAIRNNATWNRDLSDNENVELEPCSSTNKIEAGGQLLMHGDTIEDTDAKLSEGIVVPKSGPLTWLPSMEDVSNCNFVSSGKKRINIVTKLPRRRGVKMKPLGDEETNRRRLLNRKAALRYRERKRMRQNEQKRELEHLICQNSLLKRHLKMVRMEISVWKEKVNQAKDANL